MTEKVGKLQGKKKELSNCSSAAKLQIAEGHLEGLVLLGSQRTHPSLRLTKSCPVTMVTVTGEGSL